MKVTRKPRHGKQEQALFFTFRLAERHFRPAQPVS